MSVSVYSVLGRIAGSNDWSVVIPGKEVVVVVVSDENYAADLDCCGIIFSVSSGSVDVWFGRFDNYSEIHVHSIRGSSF